MNPLLPCSIVLALAVPAGASIVYVSSGDALWQSVDVTQPPPHGVPIDVNHDGAVDLGFYRRVGGIPPQYLDIRWYADATGGSGYSQSQLAAGNVVGPGTAFSTAGRQLGAYVMNYFVKPPHYEYSGVLNIPQGNSYWGLQFAGPGGETYYGWLQFFGFNDVTQFGGGSVTIRVVDYAYETSAGVPITAGAVPAPSGLAVLGVIGAMATRRARRTARGT